MTVVRTRVPRTDLPAPTGPRCLLILAHYFPPQNESGAARPFRFAKYLPEYGYHAHVITLDTGENLEGWENVTAVRAGAASIKRPAELAAAVAQRVLPYNEQLQWLPGAVRCVAELLKTMSPAAILSTSPPNCSHMAAFWLKKRYKVRWIADFRDPILDNPFRNRWGARWYDAALQRTFIKHADAVITVTDTIAEGWRRQYPQWAEKIHLIWNGYDPGEDLRALPIPQRSYQVLAHVGTIYGPRQPRALLSSLARLMSRGLVDPSTLRVQLVGSLDDPLDTNAAKECLELTGLLPRSEALRLAAEANYLLLLDSDNGTAGYAAPAKLFEYIRVGRPILAITAKGSPVDRILAGSGVLHRCLYHGAPEEEIDRQVLEFIHLPDGPVAPSSWFVTQFDGRKQAQSLAAVLDGVLKP